MFVDPKCYVDREYFKEDPQIFEDAVSVFYMSKFCGYAAEEIPRIQASKKIREIQEGRSQGCMTVKDLVERISCFELENLIKDISDLSVGSCVVSRRPGDGSAREQAASCQKVLGGWANFANEYATKRYRSNLINWGMLPFVIEKGELPFKNMDHIFIPGIRKAVAGTEGKIKAYTVKNGNLKEFELSLGELTDDERQIILKGCLINYNRV